MQLDEGVLISDWYRSAITEDWWADREAQIKLSWDAMARLRNAVSEHLSDVDVD